MCNLHHSNSFQERDYPYKRMGKWTVYGAWESRPYSKILIEIIIIYWIYSQFCCKPVLFLTA